MLNRTRGTSKKCPVCPADIRSNPCGIAQKSGCPGPRPQTVIFLGFFFFRGSFQRKETPRCFDFFSCFPLFFQSGQARPRQGTEVCNFGAPSPLEALHWIFCFFSSIYVQFSKTSPPKSGESSEKSSGENRAKSCHVLWLSWFLRPLSAPKSRRFLLFAIAMPSRTPEIARFPRQEKAMLHCDLRVRWKVASNLRFRAAISEPKTPSFCGISGDLAQSTQNRSPAIAIVRFWCAKCGPDLGFF